VNFKFDMPRGHLFSGLLLALLLLCARSLDASPLFDDQATIEASITGPFGSLFEDIQRPAYQRFSLEAGGTRQPVDVRLRGHSRLRVCEFPPLRLKFREDDEAQGIFAGQDKLKLVTHCRNHDRGEQDLLEEYTAYRILNIVTDLSYRVRLLRIRYRDNEGRTYGDAASRFGFVIESKQEFAGRTGAQAVIREGFPRYRHNQENAALVYVLQYLIANTDWMMLKADYDEECCHNVDLFELNSRIILVPYDFDVTGLVNARYAYPDPQLRIKRVTQRLYRGLCTDREYLRNALTAVLSKRNEIIAVVRDVPGLEPRNRDRAIDYLDSFFDDAANQGRLLKSFEKGCLEGY